VRAATTAASTRSCIWVRSSSHIPCRASSACRSSAGTSRAADGSSPNCAAASAITACCPRAAASTATRVIDGRRCIGAVPTRSRRTIGATWRADIRTARNKAATHTAVGPRRY
jgi:hypothetical protein